MSQPFPANPFLIGHLAPISFEADAADLPILGRGAEGRSLKDVPYCGGGL